MIRLSGPVGIASVGLLVASLLAGRVDGIPGLTWIGLAVGIPVAIGLLGIVRRSSQNRIDALGFGTALCGVLPLLVSIHVSDPAWATVSGTCSDGCAVPGPVIAGGVIAIAVVRALELGGRDVDGLGMSWLPVPSHPTWWIAVVLSVATFTCVMWVVVMPWSSVSTAVAGLVGAVLWGVFRGHDRLSAVAILFIVLLAPSLSGSAIGYALGRRPGDPVNLDHDDMDEARGIDESGVPSGDILVVTGQGVPREGPVSSEIDDVRRGALGLFGIAGWGVAMLSGAPPLFRVAGDVVFAPDPSNIALISLVATFFPHKSGSVIPKGMLAEGTFVSVMAIWVGVVFAVGWCLYPVLRRTAVEVAVALAVIATAVVSASTPRAMVPSLIVAMALVAFRARSMRVGAVLLAGIVLATVAVVVEFVDPSWPIFIRPALVLAGLLVVALRFR